MSTWWTGLPPPQAAVECGATSTPCAGKRARSPPPTTATPTTKRHSPLLPAVIHLLGAAARVGAAP
jgi:hypothetical protein